MTGPKNSFVYSAADVSRLLGLPAESTIRAPRRKFDDEVVIYYGGWPLTQLFSVQTKIGFRCPHLYMYDCSAFNADPGYYRVLPRVPGSKGKPFSEQKECLRLCGGDKWQPAPVAVAATALLAHFTATDPNLLPNDWYRCGDILPIPYATGRPKEIRAYLDFHPQEPVLDASFWPTEGFMDNMWLAAALKVAG